MILAKYTKAKKEKLKKSIQKAIEWSNVAKKNTADVSKSLGCFGGGRYAYCQENGVAVDQNQMGLRFFPANGGKQTNLIIDIIDQSNQFIKTSIYFEPGEMIQMLSAATLIEETFIEARKSAKDQALFK